MHQIEKIAATRVTPRSRASAAGCGRWPRAKSKYIEAIAVRKYGSAEAIPVIRIKVLNIESPEFPRPLMTTSAVARMADVNRPTQGASRLVSLVNARGKMPSAAAARGTSATNNVSPLSAPIPETTAKNAIA